MNETDMKSLCRLCLNKSYFYSNIYVDQPSDNIPFYEDINYVYDLHISVEDGLPEFICQKCLATVKEFKLYKTNAHIAKMQLAHLKQKMNYMHVKQEPEKFDECSFGDEMATEEIGVIAEPQLDAVIVKEETLVSDTSSSPNNCDTVKMRLQAEQAKIGPMRLKEEFGIFKTENQETDGTSNDDLVRETLVSCIREDGKEIKENFQVSSGVLRPRRGRRYQLSQSDLENSQMDGSSYEVSPNELSSSDAEEEGTVETEKKVLFGESFPRLTEDCNQSTSSAVVGGLSDLIGTAECSSHGSFVESVEVPREGDPLESGYQDQIIPAEKEESFLCGECGKKFKSKENVKQHILGMHSSEELYRCRICNKAFKTKNRLSYHALFHRESPTFRCSKCGKGFQRRQCFRDHMRRHGWKPFPCAHCNADFKSKGKLEEHYPVHDGEVYWECDTCRERYPSWSDLVRHRTMHKVKSVFKCGTCGIECSKKKRLRQHVKVHQRPYSCATCSKSFQTEYHLRMHSYTHGGLKPHQCHVCSKRFSDRGTLSKHLRTHSEERPFPCNFCSYRGSNESALKSHEHIHLTSERHKCGFCERTYVRERHKQSHEKKSHGDKMAK